jgi:hypothetical protein
MITVSVWEVIVEHAAINQLTSHLTGVIICCKAGDAIAEWINLESLGGSAWKKFALE